MEYTAKKQHRSHPGSCRLLAPGRGDFHQTVKAWPGRLGRGPRVW